MFPCFVVFGHKKFKGKQKEIVEAAYKGCDVLVVAPTGMGKSVCFQIPAIADKRGVTLVVSPLLGIYHLSEIGSLRERNIVVASVSSQTSSGEKEEVSRDLQSYDCTIRLLYVTPERLCTVDFMELLDTVNENNNLNRLVVDEAHCISEWGHHFRAEYRRIGKFRDRYPDIPIMALTATATDVVQKDIVKSLKLSEEHLFRALHPFNRVNLFYEVRYLSNPSPSAQMTDIFDYITTLYRRRGKASSGIIYCRMRKTCDELASYLRSKGLNAKAYHRGIPSATLERTLEDWTVGPSKYAGGVDIVVATIAFGLGIDKGDVRYIIHYDMPKSFEGYYQETGRAGRDGHPSKCILYYSREDAIRVKNFVRSPGSSHLREEGGDGPTPTQQASGSLDALVKFAESTTLCRHVSICRYFGEPIDENDKKVLNMYCNQMCDICKYPEKTRCRAAKLTSREAAAANYMPPWTNNAKNNPQATSRSNENEWQGRQIENRSASSRGSFGAQKRQRPDTFEGPSKKAKAPYAHMLVTKPFGSAPALSKPFRPPSFVRPQAGLAQSAPIPAAADKPQLTTATREPIELELSEHSEEDMEETEHRESSPIELPDVDMFWEPEYSMKVPTKDREIKFEMLRRSLHKVFMSHEEEAWSKLSTTNLDGNRRDNILFEVATELELSAISLSSTTEGYGQRINTMKDDIQAISQLERWDGNDRDFEDSQEVIQILRRCIPTARNGKGRLR
ncbi:ATP-dependent DNA helicase [Phlegmacium glaucopus]|nr:ATP-dependent DNA helicase [Phlegmacium glaucopus]